MASTYEQASYYPAALDTNFSLYGDPVDLQEFTLSGTLTSGGLSFDSTASAAALNTPLFIRFATGEIIFITSVSGTTFTIANTDDRGLFGTSAAEHVDEVFRAIPVAMYHKQLKNAIIAIETELGTDPAGSLTDLKTRLAVALDDDGTIKLAALNEHIGIADNDILKVDDADAADNDYAKFTANGLEGRSTTELVSDIRTDGLIGIDDDDLLEVDGSPNDNEWARFTANGIEGMTDTELVAAIRTAGLIGIDDDDLLEVDGTVVADDIMQATANGLKGLTYAELVPLLDGAEDWDFNGKSLDNIHEVGFDAEPDTDTQTNIDWTDGNNQKITLTATRTIAFGTAPASQCHLQLKVTQGGTGSYTINWPGTVKWPLGITPTLSTGVGEIDIFTFWYDGTNYFGTYGLDFS